MQPSSRGGAAVGGASVFKLYQSLHLIHF